MTHVEEEEEEEEEARRTIQGANEKSGGFFPFFPFFLSFISPRNRGFRGFAVSIDCKEKNSSSSSLSL